MYAITSWKMVQTLGVPEHHARAFLLEVEEIELTTQLAVVALLGFLDLLQVSVEVFLLRKTPCRRFASASDCWNRRANKRPRPSSA